jgi:transcriptional regulator with XRE-family HTH domain
MAPPKNVLLLAIGNTVRRLREELTPALSQEKFAALAGLDRTYQTSIERGRRNVTVLTLDRLATALQIDLGTLMRHVEEERKQLARRSTGKRLAP